MSVEIKEYLWLIPLVGAIIIVIGFFTPAAVMNFFGIKGNFWMWGYYTISGWGVNQSGFFDLDLLGTGNNIGMQMMAVSIISVILIIIGMIGSLVAIYLVKINKFPNNEIIGILMGAMALVGAIIWAAGMNIEIVPSSQFWDATYFWDISEMGFGVIGPIIGGIIVIIGNLIIMYKDKIFVELKGDTLPLRENLDD